MTGPVVLVRLAYVIKNACSWSWTFVVLPSGYNGSMTSLKTRRRLLPPIARSDISDVISCRPPSCGWCVHFLGRAGTSLLSHVTWSPDESMTTWSDTCHAVRWSLSGHIWSRDMDDHVIGSLMTRNPQSGWHDYVSLSCSVPEVLVCVYTTIPTSGDRTRRSRGNTIP